MENQKEYCEDLLNRYRDFKQKTKIQLFDVSKNGKLQNPQYIPLEYFDELDKVKKEIKECLKNFSTEVLIDFYDDFRKEIHMILIERIRNNEF